MAPAADDTYPFLTDLLATELTRTYLLSCSTEYKGSNEYMHFKVLFHISQAFLSLKVFRATLEMSKSLSANTLFRSSKIGTVI